MGFKLHQQYLQASKMKDNKIFRYRETKGLCYGLTLQWIKLVCICTKVIPQVTDLNIFRATSYQRAYALKCHYPYDHDPRLDEHNLAKLGTEARIRLMSGANMKDTIGHLFNERSYSKKIITSTAFHLGKFADQLSRHAEMHDAILINSTGSTGRGNFYGHVLALSCSTGTPIIFEPNQGQFIYSDYNDNPQNLMIAIIHFAYKYCRGFFAPREDSDYVRYAAVGISAK